MTLGRAVFAILVLVLLGAPARAAGPNDVFTVANVPVDATAQNADAARDQARAAGAKNAYQLLLARLTLAADRARLPAATDAVLYDIIASFEVTNEHLSGVRYLAHYTYHFRADAVRKLLRDAAVPFCETPSKPLVVLAVLHNGANTVLWEDPNPWRDAWNAGLPPQGLVPLKLPDGDLDDLQAIAAADAVGGDPTHLQAVSQKYGGADVLVTEATIDADATPHTLSVKSTRYSPASGLQPQSWTKTYTADQGQADAGLYGAAVAGTAAQVEDAWKSANMLDYSSLATLTAKVPTGTLNQFVDVRGRLAQIPVIQRSDILSIDREDATLQLHYYGNPDQLRTALAQHDLTLVGQDPDWTIERSAAAAAH